MAISLRALHMYGGVTAIDGGFLQVLMTTTGDTAINRAVGGGCVGGSENAPKELTEMKVRFGTFAKDGDNCVRKTGFGTIEETTP